MSNNSFQFIPVSGPSITQKEVDYVIDAVKNAWYENANMYNSKFEDAFKAYVGRNYAISLPSCTSAIHLSLLALGVGEGDEVIIPDITWIASAAPISYVGATPIFVDIDENTWCISSKCIEESITDRTKAIIIVDLYGNMPDMDEIIRISEKYNIPIIEDAAQAMGSEYKGKKAGAFGEISVFSFHGSKIMTTGEGGMLVTNNKDIYDRCMKLRDHGRANSSKLFWNDEVAYKYKMSSLQAALGLAQLERIDELVQKRRDIFSAYLENLKCVEGITLNKQLVDVKSNFWMITLAWTEKYDLVKEQFIEELLKENISSRPFFYPLSMIPAYVEKEKQKKYARINKNAYAISERAINLPSGMNMDGKLVEFVCNKVIEILDKYERK